MSRAASVCVFLDRGDSILQSHTCPFTKAVCTVDSWQQNGNSTPNIPKVGKEMARKKSRTHEARQRRQKQRRKNQRTILLLGIVIVAVVAVAMVVVSSQPVEAFYPWRIAGALRGSISITLSRRLSAVGRPGRAGNCGRIRQLCLPRLRSFA